MKIKATFILLIVIFMLCQCKTSERQTAASEKNKFVPTFVVDSYIDEHQYEGNDSDIFMRVEIGGMIENVPQWAFAMVPIIEEVYLNQNVEVLDDNAFFSCKKLSKINLNNVKVIGENCFKFSALEDVSLSNVQDIKDFAFSNCLDLKKIKFSNRLKTIGDFAFSGDSALVNCYIPSGEIGTGAFMGCSSLEQISFGKVVSIGNAAFLDCTSLTSVIIPSTMKEIGGEAFSGCVGLKEVIMNSRNTIIAEDAFAKDVIITYKN